MNGAELDDYIEAVNEAAVPFWPMVNCYRCGTPVGTTQDDVTVLDGTFEPPRWLHEDCYEMWETDEDL